jgi:hypothetical protein
MTDAKQDLIEASRLAINIWICDHYEELKKGIQCSDALRLKPDDMKNKNFQLSIKDKCDLKQI